MNKELRIGYCCINNELRKQDVYTSRTMIKRLFNMDEASNRALQNVKDLKTILVWNAQHNVNSFRVSSNLFPRMTCATFHYTFDQLKDHQEIASILKDCGDFALSTNQHLSFHPGPYTTLASPNPTSVEGAIREVEMHSLFADLIDPDGKMDIPINFHIGGSYQNTYKETAERFINVYNHRLSENAKKRVVIENDDKKNGWSAQLLYNHIYSEIGVPITFDLHHWLFCHEDDTMENDFLLAKSTWGDRSMQVHYSESKDENKDVPAHSYTYKNPLPPFILKENNLHVHLEAKGKEEALFDMRKLIT